MLLAVAGNNPVDEDEEALKEFLTDSECLDPLHKWTSGFNAFDVLGITSSEIRHSNVLAWLLSDSHRALADAVVSFI